MDFKQGALAQLARAFDWQSRGHRFDSDMLHKTKPRRCKSPFFMPYFVYILKSEIDNRFYYGQTQDLDKRVEEHNSGKSSYTKKYVLWKLFAHKSFDSRSEAIKYEKMLKNLHSKEKVLAFVLRHNFIIFDS